MLSVSRIGNARMVEISGMQFWKVCALSSFSLFFWAGRGAEHVVVQTLMEARIQKSLSKGLSHGLVVTTLVVF